MRNFLVLILFSFSVLGYSVDSSSKLYNIRGNQVYFMDKVTKIDRKSFELAAFNNIARDKKNVYYNGEIIAKADPSTFVSLNYYYAKDKNNLYYLGKILTNVDKSTFQELGYYGRDKNGVYFQGVKIQGADKSTFRVLYYNDFSVLIRSTSNYAIDKNNIYYNGKIVNNADLLSFRAIDVNKGKDKQYDYLEEKIFINN